MTKNVHHNKIKINQRNESEKEKKQQLSLFFRYLIFDWDAMKRLRQEIIWMIIHYFRTLRISFVSSFRRNNLKNRFCRF
jgi:hypothetical protein